MYRGYGRWGYIRKSLRDETTLIQWAWHPQEISSGRALVKQVILLSIAPLFSLFLFIFTLPVKRGELERYLGLYIFSLLLFMRFFSLPSSRRRVTATKDLPSHLFSTAVDSSDAFPGIFVLYSREFSSRGSRGWCRGKSSKNHWLILPQFDQTEDSLKIEFFGILLWTGK